MNIAEQIAPGGSFTLEEWCLYRRLCRSSFYNLKRRGMAPAVLRVGSRNTITREADEVWRKRMEAMAAKHPDDDLLNIAP
jgi:hypothetical protein